MEYANNVKNKCYPNHKMNCAINCDSTFNKYEIKETLFWLFQGIVSFFRSTTPTIYNKVLKSLK